MKVKIITREDLTTPGDMFLLDNARMASLEFSFGDPVLIEDDEPARIIICHPTDEPRLREVFEGLSDMELIEDPEPPEPKPKPNPRAMKCTCGHPKMAHADIGKCAYSTSTKDGLVRCTCTKFEEAQ